MTERRSHHLFPRDVLEFFRGVTRIAERARARGDLGPDGCPMWSLAEWQAFCRGARAYSHLPMFGGAVVRTVREVEACIADGYAAEDIHNILRAADWQRSPST